MRHLLILAVLLLSACGPDDDIPGVDINQSESVPAAAALANPTPHGSPNA